MWPVRIQSGDEVLECMDGVLTKILKCIRFNSRIFEYTPACEMAAFLATVTKWKCYNAVLLWNSRNILRTMKPSIKMRRADKDWFSGFGATIQHIFCSLAKFLFKSRNRNDGVATFNALSRLYVDIDMCYYIFLCSIQNHKVTAEIDILHIAAD